MFQPDLHPLGNLTASALVALLPLLVMFITLGALKWKAHWAGLASLVTALLVAVLAFKMPAGLALLARRVRFSDCSPSRGLSSPPSGCTR